MKNEELLTVDDHFLIEGVGLVVVPHLEVPDKGFSNFDEKALILSPDGQVVSHDVSFRVEHLSMKDGKSEWNIAVVFPKAKKTDIPVKSVVKVSQDVLDRPHGEVQQHSTEPRFVGPVSVIVDPDLLNLLKYIPFHGCPVISC